MNLGKLLAAGKSLMLGREGIAYRFNKVALPKFISPKNPFGELKKQNATVENTPIASARNGVAGKTQKLPTVKTATTWASKLNPISIFHPQSREANKSATPVQVELSLEKVQVLRNDLSDADVEVVPLKSNTISPPDLPPPEKPWEFLGERLFGIKPS